MQLTFLERVLLSNLLPREGKFETLLILEDVRKKIEVTQDEVKKYDVKTVDNMIQWNPEGAKSTFDIEFTEAESNAIKDIFKKLSDSEKLSTEQLPLYKMFVK